MLSNGFAHRYTEKPTSVDRLNKTPMIDLNGHFSSTNTPVWVSNSPPRHNAEATIDAAGVNTICCGDLEQLLLTV